AIVLLAGCRQSENESQLRAVNESLEYSNRSIDDANHRVYRELENKLRDPQTSSVASLWNPTAMRIQKQADSIKAIVNNLKVALIRQSDSLKKVNVPAVKQLSDPNGTGDALLNKLADFKDSIPAILKDGRFIDNPWLYKDVSRYIGLLQKNLRLLPDYTDSMPASQRALYIKKWVQNYFAKSSSLMAMLMLNKIENDVLTTEHSLIEYCNKHVVSTVESFDVFRAIATLSSSYVKAGQPIEVYAGVGSFSAASKPTIIINEKPIKLDVDATATYRFTATGKPGKYVVPVTIKFTRPSGDTIEISKQLKYIIAE